MFNTTYQKNNLVFPKINSLTIEEIKEYLKKQGDDVSKKEIQHVLIYMLVGTSEIVVDKCFDGLDKYIMLDKYFQLSSYTEIYNTCFINNLNKKILLISDTHIMSEKENILMLHDVYDYALNIGVDFVFHLGDVFERFNNSFLNKEVFKKRYKEVIEYFIDNYPNNLKTYSILGNHDVRLHKLYQQRLGDNFDLRALTYYKDKFYIFPKDKITFDNSKVRFNLNHRFYLSEIENDFHMNNIKDLDNSRLNARSFYNINISGHLHEAFLYITKNYYKQNTFYISVPSLSKLNDNKTCALLLDIYNDNYCRIKLTPLKYINNKIVLGEAVEYKLNDDIPLVRKLL